MASVSHGLGFGNGSLIEHDDGSVEYRPTGKLLPAFRVNVRDVSAVAVRKPTRDDKKRLKAGAFQQVVSLLGSGTTIVEFPVNQGAGERIEQWFRARPDFGAAAHDSAPVSSIADELGKLAQLRDAGVLTPDEFDARKAKLLAQ